MSVTDDLLQYVKDRTTINPETGCWIWNLRTAWARDPRPIFTFHGKSHYVYRKLWEYIHGVVLTHDQQVCHHCDIGLCCNPDHLFQGTATDNMRDCSNKGRIFAKAFPERHLAAILKGLQARIDHPGIVPHGDNHWKRRHPELIPRGEAHWSKRSPELIRRGSQVHNSRFSDEEIVSIREDKRLLREIAADYGCHLATISLIRNGKHYGVLNSSTSASRLAVSAVETTPLQ